MSTESTTRNEDPADAEQCDFFFALVEVSTAAFFENVGHTQFMVMSADELLEFARRNDIPPAQVTTVRAAVLRRHINDLRSHNTGRVPQRKPTI
jgi:hypothetical protein